MVKSFTFIENDPEVMTELAHQLGLSSDLAFYDVYSLDDPALLARIPRPALALLAIIPYTPAWARSRAAEDAHPSAEYTGCGPDEPVLWFREIIGRACGSIGLLHCALNGPAAAFVTGPDTPLAHIRAAAVPLAPVDRAEMLYYNAEFEAAHAPVAGISDSPQPPPEEVERLGQHFVAFVKTDAGGNGGHLWELEGSRNGPLDRGRLGQDEDVLSPRALELGLKGIIDMEKEAGGTNLRFSCIALARKR